MEQALAPSDLDRPAREGRSPYRPGPGTDRAGPSGRAPAGGARGAHAGRDARSRTTPSELVTEQLEEVQEYVDLCDLLRVAQATAAQRAQHRQDAGPTREPDGPGADRRPADRQRLPEGDRRAGDGRAKGLLRVRTGRRCKSWTTSSRRSARRTCRLLGDNIVLILNVVKDMTQPQILGVIQNIIAASENELKQPIDTSLRSLLGQMRDPDVRRGLVAHHACASRHRGAKRPRS